MTTSSTPYGTICRPCQEARKENIHFQGIAYERHIAAEHPEEYERIQLYAIQGHEKQAEWIYAHHPEARQDNGILIKYMALADPRLAYARSTEGTVFITAQYTDFFYFLRRIGGMTRAGRNIRQPRLHDQELPRRTQKGKRVQTREAVRRIMEIEPAARYNEGLLAAKLLQHFPLEGITLAYDHERHTLTLQAPEARLTAVFRYIDSIARASRKHRQATPYTDSPVAQKREVMQDFAQHYYATERQEMAK